MDGLMLALRVLVSLAAVLGVLWYVHRRLNRGSGRRRAPEAITVLGRQSLGQKAHLVIAQVDDTRYVLGVTEHGVSVIDSTPGRPRLTAVERPKASADASVPGAEPTEFDRVLAASASPEPAPLRRPRNHTKSSPIAGSILSPMTWRQTADALRNVR
ncbi:flagellar biosynthetic protein FliO [Paramicrobacterium agarici]|uniref:Flagellar protein n=1 Tax=Paramicrobacterium agarici TaxID=630514 RepID=A0A2A9DWT2_9MICO|nr:flagellar biosynthetic protein FliO [Microbacterium agarici]PFG30595.1 flagellar protein FliO/FliZ [Microbacterium agarici]TQO23613.1 flagellar protein FliO/FliZ [Microbacterium agarici]